MRKLMYVMAMLLCVAGVWASSLDDAIAEAMQVGSFIDDDGDSMFISNIAFSDGYVEEGAAYSFVSSSAMLFLVVREEWETLADASVASKIMNVDTIACPWFNGYSEFMVSIPMWEICQEFGDQDYASLDIDELLSDIQSYVNYHGDIKNLSME